MMDPVNRLHNIQKIEGGKSVQKIEYHLKPCPKCKAKGKVYCLTDLTVYDCRTEYQVGCTECDFITNPGLLLVVIDQWDNHHYIATIKNLEESMLKAVAVIQWAKFYTESVNTKEKRSSLKLLKQALLKFFS